MGCGIHGLFFTSTCPASVSEVESIQKNGIRKTNDNPTNTRYVSAVFILRHACILGSVVFFTLNSKLSTLNSQLSTLNSQLSTLNSQLSTLNSKLSTLNSHH